jgi:putative hydrolase of the HAD superfamily
VVVGDSIDKDIVPARQAGCHTVWFKGEPWTDEPVDASVAERVIGDLGDLV